MKSFACVPKLPWGSLGGDLVTATSTSFVSRLRNQIVMLEIRGERERGWTTRTRAPRSGLPRREAKSRAAHTTSPARSLQTSEVGGNAARSASRPSETLVMPPLGGLKAGTRRGQRLHGQIFFVFPSLHLPQLLLIDSSVQEKKSGPFARATAPSADPGGGGELQYLSFSGDTP